MTDSPRRRLSFRKVYIEPILAGEKVDTIRRSFNGEPGDVANATCKYGDPPFATLIVTEVETITVDQLPPERRESVAQLYPDADRLVRVGFRLA